MAVVRHGASDHLSVLELIKWTGMMVLEAELKDPGMIQVLEDEVEGHVDCVVSRPVAKLQQVQE